MCALVRPCRSAELANLSFQSLSFSPEGASASPLTPPKQCQPGRAIKEYFFPVFPDRSNICPVAALRVYCDKTSKWRSLEAVQNNPVVFLISTKQHSPASSATIARWIKSALTEAGIDMTILRLTQSEEHQHLQQQKQAYPYLRFLRQQTGQTSQHLRGFTTVLANLCHLAQLFLSLLQTCKVDI